MAPGPFGGYNGFLCREVALDVTRKDEYYQEFHRDRKQNYGGDVKVGSQRDIKQHEYGNGKPKKASVVGAFDMDSMNEKKQGVSLVSKRFVDLEPGELCSEVSSGIEDGFMGSGDMDEISLGRKRKISSIEPSMDESKTNRDCRQKNSNKVQAQIAPRLHYSLAIKSFESNSTKKVRKFEDLLDDPRISANIVHGLHGENGNPEQKTDCLSVSTISLSRWANANGSFQDDECATSDTEFLVNRRKDILLASAQDQRAELGKVIFREHSERSLSNESGSCGSCREDCPKPMRDGVDDLGEHGQDSEFEESNDSFEEDCEGNEFDYVEPPFRSINMLRACRGVDDFDKLNRINEGAYGTVYKARDKKTGEIVALKKVKMQKEREGFPLTSLREINILLSLRHPSIVDVKEVVVGRDLDDIFIVMEYVEHDLKGLLQTMKKPFHLSEVKCLMLQLLTGVKHLHDNWVLHRDLKTSNLLFNNRGELKICDFGLSRQYGYPLKPYTKLVVTLWYRAPELLLGVNEYSTAIDMWSVGCMMAELLNKEPLFPGKNELDQLDKIFRILGTPDEDIWPGLTRLPGAKFGFIKKPFKLHEKFPRKSPTSFLGQPMLSDSGFNLLNKLLTYDPEKRITAEDALEHPWFRESPLPMSKDFMPTFPVLHREDRHQQRFMKSPYQSE